MVSWTELVKDLTFSRGFTSESTLSNKSFSVLEMLGFGIFDIIKHSIYIGDFFNGLYNLGLCFLDKKHRYFLLLSLFRLTVRLFLLIPRRHHLV